MNENEYEYRVKIDDVFYGMDSLMSGKIKQPLFDKFGVGLACCAQLDLKYRIGALPEPSKGAKVIPQYRIRGSSNTWTQLGIFYIDLRSTRNGTKTLICYDSMMKADIDFYMSAIRWPALMYVLAEECASQMGVSIDPRTVLNRKYTIEKPVESVPTRTLLQYIASANGGNWIITAVGKLLLVPLFSSMPPETSYLITEYGNNIVIGGDRILV